MLKATRRKCKACREWFKPAMANQVVCSIACAKEAGPSLKAKQVAGEKRKQVREARRKLKTKSDWKREAQAAFNAYIRERDRDQPCISCDSSPSDSDLITGSRWDAGHYRSVGACPELRFEPLNCHRQCVRCNRNLSGNAVEYRIRLLDRIGERWVAWLEGPHLKKNYTMQDFIEIKLQFTQMKRQLVKERENG